MHEIAGFKMSLLVLSIYVKDFLLCNFSVWWCLFDYLVVLFTEFDEKG